MGKVDEYASGRSDGLQMALKLVEEGWCGSTQTRNQVPKHYRNKYSDVQEGNGEGNREN